jgi:aminotransferase
MKEDANMLEQMTPSAATIKQPALRAVSQLVLAAGGVNMSQGKCALKVHPVVEAAAREAVAMRYAHTATARNGLPQLRDAVVGRAVIDNGLEISADQVSITHGVTGGLECISRMFIQPGDEVILFRPAFPYYEKIFAMRGGVPVYVPLSGPQWRFDPEALAAAFGPATKLIVFCSPSNPTGKVFDREELALIATLCKKHNVIAISDEVYQHHLADDVEHVSIASLDGMFERSITLHGVSKSFFATGWRVGWAIGPKAAMRIFSIHSDQLFLCANSVMQQASAIAYANLPSDYFLNIRHGFNARAKRFIEAMRPLGFEISPVDGGYFLMMKYDEQRFANDDEAVAAVIEKCGVGFAPGYAFEPGSTGKTGYFRCSMAITDAELERAIAGLQRL